MHESNRLGNENARTRRVCLERLTRCSVNEFRIEIVRKLTLLEYRPEESEANWNQIKSTGCIRLTTRSFGGSVNESLRFTDFQNPIMCSAFANFTVIRDVGSKIPENSPFLARILVYMNRFVHLGFCAPNVLSYLVVYALKIYKALQPLFYSWIFFLFLFKSTIWTRASRPRFNRGRFKYSAALTSDRQWDIVTVTWRHERYLKRFSFKADSGIYDVCLSPSPRRVFMSAPEAVSPPCIYHRRKPTTRIRPGLGRRPLLSRPYAYGMVFAFIIACNVP